MTSGCTLPGPCFSLWHCAVRCRARPGTRHAAITACPCSGIHYVHQSAQVLLRVGWWHPACSNARSRTAARFPGDENDQLLVFRVPRTIDSSVPHLTGKTSAQPRQQAGGLVLACAVPHRVQHTDQGCHPCTSLQPGRCHRPIGRCTPAPICRQSWQPAAPVRAAACCLCGASNALSLAVGRGWAHRASPAAKAHLHVADLAPPSPPSSPLLPHIHNGEERSRQPLAHPLRRLHDVT